MRILAIALALSAGSALAQVPTAEKAAAGISTPVICMSSEQAALAPAVLNDTARFLAGMPLAAESSLAQLSAPGHQAQANAAWTKLDTRQLSKVKAFANTELVPLTGTGPLFYPFSGPDLLYAEALFPNASAYLLTGLEPIGNVPDLHSFKPEELSASLADLRKSLYAILAFSFFKTNDMRTDFRRNRFSGVLPVLLTFAAKSGFEVDGVRYFVLHPDGTRCAASETEIKVAKSPLLPGVEVRLRRPRESKGRTLTYVSTDIGDRGLAKTPQYAAMVRAYKPGVTFLKSASFLMHKDYFSSIRSLILEVSPRVIEDDSGIPYRSFNLEQWQPVFFGTYARPIPLFANFVQADLLKAFKTYGSKPLAFGIGYRHGPQDSSILMFERKP